MRLFIFTAALAVAASSASATSVYMVGNSLTADSWNFGRLEYVAAAGGKSLDGDWHIKGSTGLAGIWADPTSYTYTSSTYGTVDHALSARNWDAITLQPYHETVAATRTAIAQMTQAAHVNGANAGTPIYIFESWAPTAGGSGPHYTVDYAHEWARPVSSTPEDGSSQTKAFFDALLPAVRLDNPNVRVIPVGSAVANLEIEINAGQIHGLTGVGDLYRDGLHFDNVGRYFSELVWYSTLFKQSPQGQVVPASDNPDSANWPEDFAISPALAADLQRVAWQTVVADPRTVVPEPTAMIGVAMLMTVWRRRR